MLTGFTQRSFWKLFQSSIKNYKEITYHCISLDILHACLFYRDFFLSNFREWCSYCISKVSEVFYIFIKLNGWNSIKTPTTLASIAYLNHLIPLLFPDKFHIMSDETFKKSYFKSEEQCLTCCSPLFNSIGHRKGHRFIASSQNAIRNWAAIEQQLYTAYCNCI